MSNKSLSQSFIQGDLWQGACHECAIWNLCGGSPSAPCGCVQEDEKRYKCDECNIVCLDRKVPSSGLISEDTFHNQISEGIPLHKLKLTHPKAPPHFPVFIPLYTNFLKNKSHRNLIGIPIGKIVTAPTTKYPSIRTYVHSLEKAKDYFKAKSSAEFIAILNGKDKFLEALWRMPNRDKLYEYLKMIGVKYVTGPTFSVITEPNIPASHNVTMILRHNRIIKELNDYALIPIPNIYIRSEYNYNQWKTWLAQNHQVNLLAFDLSLRSKGKGVKKYLKNFLSLISGLKRKFHIIFTGVGLQSSLIIANQFKKIGHTFSVITSEPIFKAISAGTMLKNDSQDVKYIERVELGRESLVEFNIEVFHNVLSEKLLPNNLPSIPPNRTRTYSGIRKS